MRRSALRLKVLWGVGAVAVAIVAVLSVTDRAGAHTRITTDVTWSEHIRAIFIEKCMTCHHPGGIAPDYVDFTVYGTDTKPGARAWAVAIEEEILLDRMPPWKPDGRFGSFSNVMELSQEELELVVAWVNGGAPQGPYRNLPVPEQFQRTDWSFGRPDLVFGFPQGHVVPADRQFDTAEVVLPIEIEEDTYITGFEFLVENPKNIFRMTALLRDPEGVEIPPIEVEVQREYDPLADEDAAEEVRLRKMPKGPHFIGQWVRGGGPAPGGADGGWPARGRKAWGCGRAVGGANRRGASGGLDDAPHRPRPPAGPADRPHDLYGSIIRTFGCLIPVSRSSTGMSRSMLKS